MNIDIYIKGIDASNLNDQRKFRLNEIVEIEDSSNPEIQERKVISKKHLVNALLLLIILTRF